MITVLTIIAAFFVYAAAVVVMSSPILAVGYIVYAIIRDKKEEKAKREWLMKNW